MVGNHDCDAKGLHNVKDCLCNPEECETCKCKNPECICCTDWYLEEGSVSSPHG